MKENTIEETGVKISWEMFILIERFIVKNQAKSKHSETLQIGDYYLVIVSGAIHEYFIVKIFSLDKEIITGKFLNLNTGDSGSNSFQVNHVHGRVSEEEHKEAGGYFSRKQESLE